MCRFTLYLGPRIRLSELLITPKHSLIQQSYHSDEREEPLNGDGFGLAWYAPELGEDRPAVFRSVSPAWSNRNLVHLARVIESDCILAHVRAATGESVVSEANCHPFTSDRFSFMHNGDIGGFRALRRKLLERLSNDAFDAIEGTTDSEHLFALFLEELRHSTESDSVSRMSNALFRSFHVAVRLAREYAPAEHCYLNVAVSDGRAAVAARFSTDVPENADTLYFNTGRRYTCVGGVCRMIAPEKGLGATVVSSERLSEDPGWSPIPVNHALLIGEDRSTSLVAIPRL
jgi:predicted glutamine amidotransferase